MSRAQLSTLPVRTYSDLGELLVALGVLDPVRRRRPAPPPAAARRRIP